MVAGVNGSTLVDDARGVRARDTRTRPHRSRRLLLNILVSEFILDLDALALRTRSVGFVGYYPSLVASFRPLCSVLVCAAAPAPRPRGEQSMRIT